MYDIIFFYQFFLILFAAIAIISGIAWLIIFYFLVKHAVKVGVGEAMREFLKEFKSSEAKGGGR